jgi:monofunctional biosynthetic peptidoglycan transglycosylase
MGRKKRNAMKRRVSALGGKILLGLLAFSVLQVLCVRFIDPPLTPVMAYRWWQGEGLQWQWRDLSRISPHLQQAVMAAEDQRFPDHFGFDLRQIRRALQRYNEDGRLRGASTLTMQVARNVYLWLGFSWLRKALEVYYTVLIEIFWPKRRIMEVYLNVAEWGNGIFGAQAAARHYFGVDAAAVSASQAAALAAVLPNPRRWSPAKPTPYIRRRRNRILRQMPQFKPFK